MSKKIKGMIIQDGIPTPDNPAEIRCLMVDDEAEKYIYELQEENERLNNIINELEKYIGAEWCCNNESVGFIAAKDILDKLEELKESDKE